MFKAIIIGCGKIAGCLDGVKGLTPCSHAYAYAQTKGISVVSYIDSDLKKARKLAQKYQGSDFGTDYIASINKHRPDVVSVCTPDPTHFSIARKILMNKIVPAVIFIEKPVCGRVQELLILKRLSQKRKVVIMVNHSRRFNPFFIKLRDLIRQKAFGVPVRLDIFYYGGFKHIGVHIIDSLLFLFEDQLKFLEKRKVLPDQYKGDPIINMSFCFSKSKADVYLHAFDEKHYQLFDFDLKFSKARLRMENFESRIILETKEVNAMQENVLVQRPLNFSVGKVPPIKRAISIILEYLKTGNSKLIEDYTIAQAEGTMQVIEGVV